MLLHYLVLMLLDSSLLEYAFAVIGGNVLLKDGGPALSMRAPSPIYAPI